MPRTIRSLRHLWSLALSALVWALVPALQLACASVADRKEAAIYGPTETVLEVVAVLRRHVPDDTYRFPPATDFSGRNVYRTSLMRLENLELVHRETLRAGHMDGVIAFAKARAMERLRAYDLAAAQYRMASERDATLRDEALRSALLCQQISAAVAHGLDLVDPLSDRGAEALPADSMAVVAALDERVALLAELRGSDASPHFDSILRQEIERADLTRARYFVAMRHAQAGGNVRAVGELQRLIARHAASHRRLRHLLLLADLYADLSREYVLAVPPESLHFSPPRFQELVDAAGKLYQRVASEDGTPEKLQASRSLEAFLAFTLQVDRDRIAQ